MATVNDTKNRLGSAKTTQKVIKAMELVASSKIKKAKQKALNVEEYYNTTMDAMRNLYTHNEVKNYINKSKGQEKTLFVLVTSDLGLCGAYNSNVMRLFFEELKKVENSETIVIGSKGAGKLKYENINVDMSIVNFNLMKEEDIAHQISDYILNQYESGLISEIKIVYTKYINALRQEAQVIDVFDIQEMQISRQNAKPNLLIEPSEEEIFEQLMRQYILSLCYTAVLQSFASEHSYRRNSMESANKNSLELIDKLNIELNRIRQAMITQEISEIIGGSEALNEGS